MLDENRSYQAGADNQFLAYEQNVNLWQKATHFQQN